jgi:hypothetical protein
MIGSDKRPRTSPAGSPASSIAAERQEPASALAGHEVQTARSQGARHPILRALENFGRLLARTLVAALPCCSRARSPIDRAVDDTRDRLERVLQRLASGKANAASLAGDLRKFAQAFDRLERQAAPNDATRRFDETVTSILTRWEPEQGLALVTAVHEAFKGVQDRIDRRTYRALMIVTLRLTRIATDRALGDIDRQLRDAVREIHDDPSRARPSTSANRAIASAVAVLNWVGDWRCVASLELRLRAAGATDDDIRALIRELNPGSLKELRTRPPTGFIDEVVDLEIAERGIRAFASLRQEIASFADRPDEAPSNEVTRLNTLLNATRRHSVMFGQSLAGEPQVRAQVAAITAKYSPTPTHDTLEKKAIETIEDLVDRLDDVEAPGRIATFLMDCTEVTAALRAYLAAGDPPPAPGTEKDRFAQEFQRMILVVAEVSPVKGRAQRLHEVLSSPEGLALHRVLGKAARRAARAELHELKADLDSACAIFDGIANLAAKRSCNARVQSADSDRPAQLSPDACDALDKFYSALIGPKGEITLTAGVFAETFAVTMRSIIEQPAGVGEFGYQELPGGTVVPKQFYLDANRGGVIHLQHDGSPLIDRADRMSRPKDERIESGYQDLVEFYEGDTQRTEALVQFASQTALTGFQTASHEGDASPIVLDRYGPGKLTGGAGLGGSHLLTVRYCKGENGEPRAHMTYEVHGGHIQPSQVRARAQAIGIMDDPPVYLDRERSRAKITFVLEARESGNGVIVIGRPRYDVRLVRNWIDRPYPPPVPDHLIADHGIRELYEDLISFASERRPDLLVTLKAMDLLRTLSAQDNATVVFNKLLHFHDSHLREGAAIPRGGEDIQQSLRERFEQVLHLGQEMYAPLEKIADERIAQIERSAEIAPTPQGLTSRLRSLTSSIPRSSTEPNLRARSSTGPKLRASAEQPSAFAGLPDGVQTRDSEKARLREFRDMTQQWRSKTVGRDLLWLEISDAFVHCDVPLFDERDIEDWFRTAVMPSDSAIAKLVPLAKELLHAMVAELPMDLFAAFIKHQKAEFETSAAPQDAEPRPPTHAPERPSAPGSPLSKVLGPLLNTISKAGASQRGVGKGGVERK